MIPGIDEMTSSSSQGSTNIALQFNLDKNLGDAANDVQSAISRATRQLPRTMINPPTYNKVNPTELPILSLALSSKTLPITTVDKYAEELLARRLSTLTGVAQVNVNGSQQYAVRIQADPGTLAVRGIGIDTLASAIAATNIDEATGALNAESDAHIIHTNGQLVSADAYRQPDHHLPEWRPGAHRRCRHRDGQFQRHALRQLGRRPAGHCAAGQSPARLQHHRGGGQYQEGAAAVPGDPAALDQAASAL